MKESAGEKIQTTKLCIVGQSPSPFHHSFRCYRIALQQDQEPSHFSHLVFHIANHVAKYSQYCDSIVTILSKYRDRIIHYIVNFHNMVVIYVNHILNIFDSNSNSLWHHMVDIYDNHIVKICQTVGCIVTKWFVLAPSNPFLFEQTKSISYL